MVDFSLPSKVPAKPETKPKAAPPAPLPEKKETKGETKSPATEKPADQKPAKVSSDILASQRVNWVKVGEDAVAGGAKEGQPEKPPKNTLEGVNPLQPIVGAQRGIIYPDEAPKPSKPDKK